MSEAESSNPAGPLPTPSPAAGSRASSALPARVGEWFWRGDAVRDARGRAAPPRPKQGEFVRRARIAAEAGQRLLEPSPPLEAGSPAALSLELHRQSIYWSLLARDGARQGQPGSTPEWAALGGRIVALSEPVRSRLPETPESLAELERVLSELDFRAIAELSTVEQSGLATRIGRLSQALLDGVLEPARRLEELWFERALRTGALLVVLLGLGSVAFAQARAGGTDLALGRDYRASSVGYAGCKSPVQDCGSDFFFHTQAEEQPWLEIDLGRPEHFSAVRVQNRVDCCGERATPLVVEVSDDGKRYRQVARRDETFQSWNAGFAAVTARYVRVRALQRTTLHLRQIAVLK